MSSTRAAGLTKKSLTKTPSKRSTKKNSSQKKQAIIKIIALAFFIGIIFGAAFSLFGGVQASDSGLENYLHSLAQGRPDTSGIFRNGILKYGKFIIIIWLLAFAPPVPCLISASLIMGAKGVSYGFTTTALIKAGAFEVIPLYLPQLFITVPAYIILSRLSVNYSLEIAEAKKNFSLKEYFIALLAGLCVALAASLADSFLLPWLVAPSP